MTRIHRISVFSLVAVLLVSMFTFTQPAEARHSKNWEYATYGLGALAVYNLMKGKTTTGLVIGAGAVYTNSRARKARRDHRFDSRFSSQFNDEFDSTADFNFATSRDRR